MSTYIVTRHSGAIDWFRSMGYDVDNVVAHFNPSNVMDGDVIVGTLPINLAAEVCRRGGRYCHLSLTVPAERRGSELTPEDMISFGAKIEEYHIERRRS